LSNKRKIKECSCGFFECGRKAKMAMTNTKVQATIWVKQANGLKTNILRKLNRKSMDNYNLKWAKIWTILPSLFRAFKNKMLVSWWHCELEALSSVGYSCISGT